MIETITQWIEAHRGLVTALGVVSAVMFVGSLIAIPWLVARIPERYFASKRAPKPHFAGEHPAIARSGRILKNTAGAILIVAGIAMLVLPGQGVISMLVGLMLLEFPGKRRLELAIVRRKPVLRALNWMRAKSKKPPLVVARPDDA